MAQAKTGTKTNLLDNSRFYILSSSILMSLMVVTSLRLKIPSDQLFYIRTEQLFGLLAIVYWYIALIISPLSNVIGKERMKRVIFARRGIGVSAAYFAVLHSSFALWGQLGGVSQIQYLPDFFKWSIAGGAIGLGILLVMAATSFDTVVRFMTYRRWKLLHRLTYIAGVCVLLHIWTVGTYMAYSAVQIAAFVALVILIGLETYRAAQTFAKRYKEFQSRDYFYVLFLSVWIFWVALLIVVPNIVQNYHAKRHMDTSQHGGGSNHE
jgi:DMSO/TMAO reductase YedYZ heme-binding membrane subunit